MDYHVSSKVEKRGVLVGILLGNAYKRQNNFYIQHPAFQEDYVLFKQRLLEQITQKPVSLYSRFTKKGDRLLCLEPKLIPLIRVLVKKRFPGGTQKITREILELLTMPGIALWFLDKGSKSLKKNGKIHGLEITLNTRISQAENELIIAYFSEVWEIKWGLIKGKNSYRLRMGTKAGKEFLERIRPYVPETMLYKVETETSSNVTATT